MYKFFCLCCLATIASQAIAQQKSLRDPTQPRSNAATSAQNTQNSGSQALRVNALFHQGQNAYASINGKVRKVGERWGQAKLLRITHNSAVLLFDNEEVEVFVTAPSSVKKDVSNDF